MLLNKLIQALLPSFGKDRVLEDLLVTRGELESLAPIYAEASRLLRSRTFAHKDIDFFNHELRKNCKIAGSDNIVVAIEKAIDVALKNTKVLEDFAQNHLQKTIATAALTYVQANVIQYTNALGLFVKYSRKLLNYIYVAETLGSKEGGETAVVEAMGASEIQWLKDTFLDFCHAFSAASNEPAKTVAGLQGVPDAVVSEQGHASLSRTMGDAKLDPLKLGFIKSFNPIYVIRVIVAEAQVARYNAAKAEVDLIKLRKLNLELLDKSKEDPRIQKQIEWCERRLDGLNYKIHEMEQDHGAA